MSIWKPNSTKFEPSTELTGWRVYKVPATSTNPETIHFSGSTDLGGWCRSGEGRVSSNIESFDKSTMCGISRSGRRYVLSGPPGYDSNALYVWNNWLGINKVSNFEDVTAEYSAEG